MFEISNLESQLDARIRELAECDAAKGVYMGSEFIAFRKEYVRQVSFGKNDLNTHMFDMLRLMYYDAYRKARNSLREQSSRGVESVVMEQFA